MKALQNAIEAPQTSQDIPPKLDSQNRKRLTRYRLKQASLLINPKQKFRLEISKFS